MGRESAMSGMHDECLPLVSICVIAYNQVEFIAEAIESCMAQDYPNLEVIVADDDSVDGTVDIISSYASKYPGVVIPLVGGSNLGISGNCNRALECCRGKYAVFMGGDDVLLPQKVRTQVGWLEQNDNRVLCGHQLEVFYEDNSRSPHLFIRTPPSGNGPEWLIRNGCPYGAMSIMVRCSFFPQEGFNSDLRYVSDQLFWIECLMAGGEYGYIDEVLGRYRRHSNNITSQVDICLSDIQQMFNYLEKKYPKYKRDITKGRINQVDCPKGIWLIKSGSLFKGMTLLLRVLLMSPRRIFLSITNLLENLR